MDQKTALRAIALLEAASAPGADPGLSAEAHQVVQQLFQSNQERVHRVCIRFVKDPELARDLAQDTFVTAWRRLGEWRGDGAFFTWLYGIARFTCMNALRRRRELLADDGVVDDVERGPGAFTQLRRHERDLLLQAAVAVLSEIEREVLYLFYTEGLGLAAITTFLDLPGSGARAVLIRARRKLEAELVRRGREVGVDSSYFLVTA